MKRYTIVLFSLALILFLAACSSSNDDTFTPVAPVVGFNFPPANAGTTSQDVTLFGVAVGVSSDIRDLQIALDDVNQSQSRTELGLRWSHELLGMVSGNNTITATVTDADLSASNIHNLVSGTSWMLERGLQLDTVNDRWLVLDELKKTLVEIAIATGTKAEVPDPMMTVAFDTPEDMVIDENPDPLLRRALVVDSGLQAVIEINLDTMNRSIWSGAGVPDNMNLFQSPIAIDISDDRTKAYVLDAGRSEVLEVDLVSRSRTVVSAAGVMGSDIEFMQPLDIAFKSATELFVTDIGLNGVIAVDPTTGIRTEYSSSTNPNSDNAFSLIKNIVVDGDFLFVSDTGLDSLIQIDTVTSPMDGRVAGDREIFSFAAILPEDSFPVDDNDNPFLFPTGLALDKANEHILVLDNALGVIVEVDTPAGTSPGRRTYSPGGASIPATATVAATVTGRQASGGTSFEQPNKIIIDSDNTGLFAIDSVYNDIFAIGPVNGVRALVVDADDPSIIVFSDLQSLAYDGSTDPERILAVDVGLDQLIAILSSGERSVVSGVSAVPALQFNDVRDSVLVGDKLYVLIDDVAMDSVLEIDLTSGMRTALVTTPAIDATFMTPTAMVASPSGDKLFISEESTHNLFEIDLSVSPTPTLTSLVPYSNTADVVDMTVDTRGDGTILLLDKNKPAIFSIGVDGAVGPEITGPMAPDANNEFISANSLVFDETREWIHVLDDKIRSVFIVDVKDRNGAAEGQRVVTSRGTSLND